MGRLSGNLWVGAPRVSTRAVTWLLTAMTALLVGLLVAGAVSAATIQGTLDRVWAVAFSPTGRYVAVVSNHGATIYEPEGMGKRLFVPLGQQVVFSTYEELVAVNTNEKVVVQPLGPLLFKTESFFVGQRCIAISPKGDQIAVLMGEPGRLEVLDVESLQVRWSTVAHEEGSLSVAFSPDGSLVASGGRDTNAQNLQVRLWDAADGALRYSLPIYRHAYIDELSFADSGKTLVVVLSDGGENYVYDLTEAGPAPLSRHPLGYVRGRAVLSKDGRYLVSETVGDGRSLGIRVSEAATMQSVMTTTGLRGHAWDAVFTGENRSVKVATIDGRVTEWNLTSGRCVSTLTGNRMPQWQRRWTALIAASAAWMLVWLAAGGMLPRTAPFPRDWFLVPAVGVGAAFFIVVLHAIQVSEPWTGRELLTLPPIIALVQLGCLLVFPLAAGVLRAWRALVLSLLVFPALLIVTGRLWMEAVASV